jgi:hypothetical protein
VVNGEIRRMKVLLFVWVAVACVFVAIAVSL